MASRAPVGVCHTQQPDPCESHIGEDPEIDRPSNLIEDDEVRPNEEDDLSGLLHVALKWGVLSDTTGELEIAVPHRLDHRPDVLVEVGHDRLCQRGLP